MVELPAASKTVRETVVGVVELADSLEAVSVNEASDELARPERASLAENVWLTEVFVQAAAATSSGVTFGPERSISADRVTTVELPATSATVRVWTVGVEASADSAETVSENEAFAAT